MKPLSQSSRVLHDKYGLGVVSAADPDYTVIEFDEHGTKKFLTRLVNLRPSDEPAPKRRRGTRQKTSAKATKKTPAKKTAKKSS